MVNSDLALAAFIGLLAVVSALIALLPKGG
jgi:hypothetical protein